LRIVIGGWFKLPRLGMDVFSALMKIGVRYDREMGFMLSSDTDVDSAVRVISRSLGEPVELSLRCFVCLNVACEPCPYVSICDRRKVASMCLCSEHSRGEGAYEGYVGTFVSSLAE
jgi:hypothetical protein